VRSNRSFKQTAECAGPSALNCKNSTGSGADNRPHAGEVAGHRQHGLALDLIAEDRDGREVAPQRQLVAVKQRARGDREIGLACFAAEPGRTIRPIYDPTK
jgi:hypothetical protein